MLAAARPAARDRPAPPRELLDALQANLPARGEKPDTQGVMRGKVTLFLSADPNEDASLRHTSQRGFVAAPARPGCVEAFSEKAAALMLLTEQKALDPRTLRGMSRMTRLHGRGVAETAQRSGDEVGMEWLVARVALAERAARADLPRRTM